jgi:hypothetical protein
VAWKGPLTVPSKEPPVAPSTEPETLTLSVPLSIDLLLAAEGVGQDLLGVLVVSSASGDQDPGAEREAEGESKHSEAVQGIPSMRIVNFEAGQGSERPLTVPPIVPGGFV